MNRKILILILCGILLALVFGGRALGVTLPNDVDGNGRSDIITIYRYDNVNTGLWTFNSNGSSFSPFFAWSSGPGNWDWSRSRPTFGDFNGDGKGDAAILYDYGNSSSGLWIFQSTGSGFSLIPAWSSGPGNWEWWRSKLTSGDFDGDGKADLAVLYDYGNANTGIWIFKSSGASFTPIPMWSSGPGNWEWSRSKLTSGDFDGDGKTDLAVLYDYGNASSGLWIFKSTGAGLTPLFLWSSGPGNWDWGRSKLTSGDFNGDGKTDFAVLYDYGNANTGLWIFQSTGAGFNLSPVWFSGVGNWDWWRIKIVPGDFNGDGKGDVGALYDYGGAATGAWVFKGSNFPPAPFWSSGQGNWDWVRTRGAGGDTFIPRTVMSGVKWIDVNLSVQVLTCFENTLHEPDEGVFTWQSHPVFSTLVSTGKPGYETPVGTFPVYWKDPLVDMSATPEAAEFYYVPNVPWVLWFIGGYSIHGTYWHSDFGRVRSHGCVNAPVAAAQWIYNWAPVGTPVVVHY